jgi:hypothetical protein
MLYPLSYEGGRSHPSWWRSWGLLTARPAGASAQGAFRDGSVQSG